MKRTLVLLAALSVALPAAGQPPKRDPLLLSVNRAEEQLRVFKIDGTDLALVKKLPLGKTPREICVSPDGKRAYVPNADADSVTSIDLDALAVAATIQALETAKPDGCLVSADSKTLYLTSTSRDSVVVIDAATGKVTKEIPTGLKVPRRLVLTPDGKKLWVGMNKSPEVAVIDLAKGVAEKTVKVGNEPRGGPAITPDGKTFLVGNVEDDTVSWVDTTSYEVTRVTGVPISPQRIVVSKDGDVAYVLTRFPGGGIFAMPLKAAHDKSKLVPLGKAPWGLAMNGDGTLLYASNNSSDDIMVISIPDLKLVNTVPAGKDPNGLAVRP